MKALEQRMRKAERLEADLGALVASLFVRWPALCGFAVREDQRELYVSDIGVYPAITPDQYKQLHAEISAALAELVQERPEAAELLRSRTFAWLFH